MPNEDLERLPESVVLQVVRAPARVGEELQAGLAACWQATTNAGGAVGFPWPPVTRQQVRRAVDQLVVNIEAGQTVLVVATDERGVAGWACLDRNDARLVAHWASVRRLQTHPRARGLGIGHALMAELARLAGDDGLQQLHLTVRGGMGLEDFYRRLGWNVVGRWPDALRLADDDYRDEVLMMLQL